MTTKELAEKAGINSKLYSSQILGFEKISFEEYKQTWKVVERYFLSGERGRDDWPEENKRQLNEKILEKIILAKETRKFIRFEIWVPLKEVYNNWFDKMMGIKSWKRVNNGIVIGFTDWSNNWGSNYEDVEETTGIEFWSNADMENCRVTHLICEV